MLFYRPSGVSISVWRHFLWITFSLLSNGRVRVVHGEFSYEAITAVLARININYIDPISKEPRSITAEIGRFADGAIGPAAGVLVNPPPRETTPGTHYLQGCEPNWAKPPPTEPWIALLLRGGCSDPEKIRIAVAQNASAVLLFGSDNETYLQKETKFDDGVVVVYLLRRKGEQLAYLTMNGTKVYISIMRGQEVKFRITSINNNGKTMFMSYNPLCSQQRSLTDCAIMTSVLFVSVSFIVLMVVSLAWLVFYYIQRFRYMTAKDKLARQLNHVAKKAVAKIPIKNLKSGDMELQDGDSCAVCIDTYQTSDSIRILPCKHHFHKSCVDPWLLEHRTCPMCKMDILKYYGYVTNGAEEDDSRTIPTLDPPGLESGSRDFLHSRGLTSGGTPQISVISHSEVPASSTTYEQSSSNPVDSLAPPSFACHHSLSDTATSVIRSLISTRPRVSPVQAYRSNDSNNNTNTNNNNEQTEALSEVLHKGGNHNATKTGVSSEIAEVTESVDLDRDYRGSESAVEPGQNVWTSQSSNKEPDIDSFVQEIMDFDQDDTSTKSVTKSSSQASIDSQILPPQRSEVLEMEDHPENACSVIPSSAGDLPAVDCNQGLGLTIEKEMGRSLRSRSVSSGPKRKLSLQEPGLEVDPFRGRSTATSADETRRPSSHLVTISHS